MISVVRKKLETFLAKLSAFHRTSVLALLTLSVWPSCANSVISEFVEFVICIIHSCWLCKLLSEPHLTEVHMLVLATLIRDLDREMTSAHSGIDACIINFSNDSNNSVIYNTPLTALWHTVLELIICG